MNILYSSPKIVVIHGTAEEVCSQIRASVVICDPPYTEHVHGNIRSCTTNGKLKVKAWEPGFDALTNFSHVPLLLSAAERWCLAFCALESFGDYRAAAGGDWKQGGSYVRSGIWRKQQAAPQLSGDRPANSCEGIAVMHQRIRGKMHWNGRGKHAFWRDSDPEEGEALFVEHGRERAEKIHPAQKPQALMSELISLFSDPGESILDPYAGSGATGRAALALGRTAVLADQDLKWAEHCASLAPEWEKR